MTKHLIWAIAVYATAVVIGATVLYATGNAHAVGDFVGGAIFAPVIIGFLLTMFIG